MFTYLLYLRLLKGGLGTDVGHLAEICCSNFSVLRLIKNQVGIAHPTYYTKALRFFAVSKKKATFSSGVSGNTP